MAQSGFTPILLYASNTTTSVPAAGNLTNSANGAEVAVNTADKRLFTKDSGGAVVELGTNPSTFSLPNGTANGVLYLNGSKVATSGSALSFSGTVLGVSTAGTTVGSFTGASTAIPGTAGFWNNAVAGIDLYDSAGSVGFGVGIRFRPNNGGTYPVAGIAALAPSTTSSNLVFHVQDANGSVPEQMRLTSTGLGIGTSSFSFIASGAETGVNIKSSGVNAAGINVSSSNANNTRMEMFAAYSLNQGGFYLKGDSAYPAMVFGQASGATTRDSMTLDASGNLGLGVTPSAVSVSDKVVQVGAFLFNNNTNGYGILRYNNFFNGTNDVYYANGSASAFQMQGNAFKWYTAPSGTAGNAISFTQAMTLDASGNLGVGTTSPSSLRLTLEGNAGQLRLRNSTTRYRSDLAVNSLGTVEWNCFDDTGGVYMPINLAASVITFQTTSGGTATERARITSGGDLLVGTTAQIGNERFGVDSGSGACGKFKGGTSANVTIDVWNPATTGDNIFVAFRTETVETTRGTITYNRAGGLVAYNTTSDYRAKDILGPVQNTGATIDALKVYEGKMKGATQSRPMLIAHEAQEHAPYAVSGVKDEVNEDGTPKFQQIDVSSLVPLLLAEIQSLRARVAALEAQP